MRSTRRSKSAGWDCRTKFTARTAARRFSRAIIFVKRLLSTTAVYSSGPVTLLMQKAPPLRSEKSPSESHMRAVSTTTSTPPPSRKCSSSVARAYLRMA